jgi:hypothetical protein
VSPNHAEGRLGLTGQVFFLNGCETQKRKFVYDAIGGADPRLSRT